MAEKKPRLDVRLVDLGLVESRNRAQALIMAGQVLVDDRPITKAGTRVKLDAVVRLRGKGLRFVSRGGDKLDGALAKWPELVVEGRVAIDVGASTGGFTDCLLQRGAARVFAVDVGYGQLAWKLQSDERVVVMDRTNIRHLEAATLQELGESEVLPDLAVADVSFISLRKVLEPLDPLLARPADLVVLIKPQFEVGKGRVGRGGVVRDDGLRTEAIDGVLEVARGLGWSVVAGADSDTPGAKKGNIEYLAWLHRD